MLRVDAFVSGRRAAARWTAASPRGSRCAEVRLGYTDLKMTLRYAHLAPDHLPGEMMKTERSGNNIDPLQHKINADPVLAAAK